MCKYIKFLFMTFFALVSCTFFSISAGAANTWEVYTPEDWQEAIESINSSGISSDTINLNADINLKGLSTYGAHCIIRVDFSGTINGNGYTLSNILNPTPVSYNGAVGLVCNSTGCNINNLTLQGCDFTFDNVEGAMSVGAFVGRGRCTLVNCYSVSNIINVSVTNTSVNSSVSVGGIVGLSSNNTVLNYCYNLSDVVSNSDYVGGLIGYSGSNITVIRCANFGNLTNVYNPKDINYWVGGLIGRHSNSEALVILHSFNRGDVTLGLYDSSNYVYVGGIVGRGEYKCTITNCYNTGDVFYSDVAACDNIGNFPNYDDTYVFSYNYYIYKQTDNVEFISAYLNTSYSSFLPFDSVQSDVYISNFFTDYVYIYDSKLINSGYPVHFDTYDKLFEVISGISTEPGEGSVNLNGYASGFYDKDTGEFSYNIIVNSPDYSGALGNPNYNGSYTIPGEADDVGVDINDMSGLDTIIETDFSSLFVAIPVALLMFTDFTNGIFILLAIFILLICLIAWFIGRKV